MCKAIYLFLALILFSCHGNNKNNQGVALVTKKIAYTDSINNNGKTVKTRFNTLENYYRIPQKPNSFAYYLQNFPLKPINAKVHLYNGELKNRQDVHAAVLDIDVGKRDLQQCADATMRIRAEYLYQKKEYDKISFNFTNGFKASYAKWRQGYRIKVAGNQVNWTKSANPDNSYQSFRKYLVMVFSYAGTLSLEKELPSIKLDELQIGDLFIQGGSPGHAIFVMDMALNKKGEKVFLLAQSYMPAQEIHILKNPNNSELSPWYSTKNLTELITPEWVFSKNDVKRFN